MNDPNGELKSNGEDIDNDLPLMMISKKMMKRIRLKKSITAKEALINIASDLTLKNPITHYGLFLCNDGIFMNENRNIGSYHLEKMESIQVKKREKSSKFIKVLLPSGDTQEMEFFDSTTARGILREIRDKPDTFSTTIPTLTYTTSSGKEITISAADTLALSEGLRPNATLRYGEKELLKKQPSNLVNRLNRSNSDVQQVPLNMLTSTDNTNNASSSPPQSSSPTNSSPLKRSGNYVLTRTGKTNNLGKSLDENVITTGVNTNNTPLTHNNNNNNNNNKINTNTPSAINNNKINTNTNNSNPISNNTRNASDFSNNDNSNNIIKPLNKNNSFGNISNNKNENVNSNNNSNSNINSNSNSNSNNINNKEVVEKKVTENNSSGASPLSSTNSPELKRLKKSKKLKQLDAPLDFINKPTGETIEKEIEENIESKNLIENFEKKKKKRELEPSKISSLPQSRSDFDISSKATACPTLSLNLTNSKRSSVNSVISPRKKLKDGKTDSARGEPEIATTRPSRSKSVIDEPKPNGKSLSYSHGEEIEFRKDKKPTISINVLIEEVRKTVKVNFEIDGKNSALLQTIHQQLEESEITLQSPLENYSIYHPIKNKMSMSTTIKAYNLKNEDLLIFKENIKKKQKKTTVVTPPPPVVTEKPEKIEKTEKAERKKFISRFKSSTSASVAAVVRSKHSESVSEVKIIEPHVIRKLVRTLTVCSAEKEVGIFRISGSTEKILQIIHNINNPGFQVSQLGPHEIAGALKFIFRNAEEPLIPPSLYNQFTSCHDGNVVDKEQLKANIKLLSEDKRNILGSLMMYLNELSNNSEVNLMTKQNIAIVFGPTLLRTMNSDAALDFSRTGSLSDIVECMIEYVTDFFDEEERSPGPFTPRANNEELEKENLTKYTKIVCDIQSPINLSDVSVYESFSSLISEDENFANYLESYSKKELLQIMSKVVSNFAKSAQSSTTPSS